MKCEKCHKETHGGYCDCMIVNGVFKGKWWNKIVGPKEKGE